MKTTLVKMTDILNCFMSQRAVYMEMLTVDSFSNNVNLSKRCTNIAVGGLQKKKKKLGHMVGERLCKNMK